VITARAVEGDYEPDPDDELLFHPKINKKSRKLA